MSRDEVGLDELLTMVETMAAPALRAALTAYADRHGHDVLVDHLLLPLLREVGLAWETGRLHVGHEHHVSVLVRSFVERRLPETPSGTGPAVVLACPPNERHDLPLTLFGLLLADRGWRPVELGAATPGPSLTLAVRQVAPAAVVIASRRVTPLVAMGSRLNQLARAVPVFVGGPAAAQMDLRELQLTALPAAMGEAADLVIDLVTGRAEAGLPA